MRLIRSKRGWPCWDCIRKSPRAKVGLRFLHYFTALLARSEFFRGVVVIKVIKKIGFDVVQLKIRFMQFVIAIVAEPK